MTQAVVEHFVLPLSACFAARPGQDFEAFAKQLIDDLKGYPAPVLDEAALTLRRSHLASTWPTIAVCLKAVQEAANRQYVPAPPEPAPDIPRSPRVAAGLRALCGILAASPRPSDPHFDERRREMEDDLGRLLTDWRR